MKKRECQECHSETLDPKTGKLIHFYHCSKDKSKYR